VADTRVIGGTRDRLTRRHGPAGQIWGAHVARVLGLLALGAAAACLLALVLARSLIAQGFDWADWALVIPIVVFTVVWLVIMAAITEWTIAGHELRRRRWLSWPGREPSTVMELGPQLEIVHETRSGWRIRPYGPTIYVPFRRTTPSRARWSVPASASSTGGATGRADTDCSTGWAR